MGHSVIMLSLHSESRIYGTDWLGMGTSMFLTKVVARKSVWALSNISPRLALQVLISEKYD